MSRIVQVPHPGNTVEDPATGGMIALLPDPESTAKLRHLRGLPSGELHATVAYLGDDIANTWPGSAQFDIVDRVRSVVDMPSWPLTARAFAHATFNPDGGPDGDRDPCAVYLIGDSDDITGLRSMILATAHDVLGARRMTLPRQHEPYVPHITAGYGLTAADLTFVGEIRFDRVAVVLADQWVEVHP